MQATLGGPHSVHCCFNGQDIARSGDWMIVRNSVSADYAVLVNENVPEGTHMFRFNLLTGDFLEVLLISSTKSFFP